MIARLHMKESNKSKKEIELKQLEALEKSIKIQDKKTIEKLIQEIGTDTISIQKFIRAINSEISFDISIESNTEEE
jgi:hypothetical protein